MGAKVGNIGGSMVELATLAMNTRYTGNEPWVARIEEFDMIYVESNYGTESGYYSVATQIYSSATFKDLLDKGLAITSGSVYILVQSLDGSYHVRYVNMNNGNLSGEHISSLKIYGIKL